jgi:Apolipoprotein A1/A4/E domain
MANKPIDNRRRNRLPTLDAPELETRVAPEQPQIRNRPANENDPTTAMMLSKLRRKPSNSMYAAAFGLSLIWIFGWFFIHSDMLLAVDAAAKRTPADLMQALTLLVMPVIAVFAIAYFLRRAQQLQHVSEILMQSAMRLIRPQDLAADGLTSIAQAVRQEVDLLVGGVEHAFQRATALEEIVHKEIAAVERAFGTNEDRIRDLVNGLESQRVALQQTSALVSSDAGPMLSRLESNTQNLGQVINLALSTFTRLEDGLKGSTTELAQTIEEVSSRAAITGQEIGGHSAQFERMSTMLVNDFRGFSGQLQEYIQSLNFTASNLGNETRKFGGEVKGMESSLLQLLRQSTEQLTVANTEVGQTIERLSNGSVTNMQKTAGELAQSFGALNENLTYHLKTTSTELASLIERTGIDTAQRIDQSNSLVTQGLQSVAANFIDKVHTSRDELTNYVGQAAGQIAGNVDAASSRLVDRVNQSGVQLLAGLDQTGNQLLTQLGTSSAGFAGRLEQATGSLSDQLEQHASTITDRIDHASTSLVGRLDQHANTINSRMHESAERYAGSVSNSSEAFTTVVENALGQAISGLTDATTRIDSSASTISTSLGHASSMVANQMQAVGSNVNDLLVSTSGTIAAHLKETSEIVSRQMQDSGLALAQNIENSGGLVTDRLISVSGEFVHKVDTARDGMLSALANSAGDLTSKLHDTSMQMYSRLDQTSTQITNQMSSTSDAVTSHIAASTKELASTLQSSTLHMFDTLDKASSEIFGQLSITSDSINTTMASRTRELTSTLQSSTNELFGGLDEVSSHITGKMNTAADAIAGNISATTTELTSKLSNSTNELFSGLDEVSNHISDRMTTASDAITGHITTTTGILTSKLQSSTQQIFTNLDQASVQFTDQLESTSSRITDHIVNTAGNATERVTSVTQGLTSKLDASSTQLGTLIGTTESRLGNQLEQATTELAALFEANTRMMTEQLDQTSTVVTTTFATTAVRAAQALNNSSTDVTSKIEAASQTMFNRLEGTTRELGQRFDVATDHLERVTDDISTRLDGTGKRFADVLSEASGQMFSDLGKAREAFSEGLGETTMQISGRFEQETGLLVGRIDRAAQDFDSSASKSTGKLDDATQKFAKHIETANTYLADQLVSAASDLDSRLESVSMQLTGKLEMTGSRISERLDDVSSLVEKSIDKFNSEMEHMLQSRKDTLDTLVSDANRRAGEVDGVMTGYINLIEESLTTAENRAQNINRIVSDQTAAALARLEDELRKLETNSSSQVSQAARVLREQHERALASMNEMLSSTASDFQQTAQDMRITAQQVVKDIDAARGELKRAVIDLPEETRNNADNMRRVVADQISALNALSEVVRRQSGSMDYSGPGFISPRSPQGSGSGKSEGASYSAPVTGTMSAPKATAERNIQAERNSNAKILASIDNAIAARKPPAPQASPLNALAKEVDSFTQKLHASARDLVEAIEGGLPRDLEKRFAGSDKSVFTQRLYENRTRKQVKAIESRYAEERLLRTRVQAYNRLFEKLLDTLSETPGGEAVMEQVLASEHGRIYVMLAEAAGRLPTQN